MDLFIVLSNFSLLQVCGKKKLKMTSFKEILTYRLLFEYISLL